RGPRSRLRSHRRRRRRARPLRATRLRAGGGPALAPQRHAVSDLARRAIAWRHGYHAAVGNLIEPWAHGTVVRADDMPSYYEYNLARAEGPDPGLGAEALAAAAEPALA